MSPANFLILPGLLEDAEVFEQLIGGLGGVAACKVADLSQADTIAAMAQTALEQAAPGPLHIAGHSMGGYVAFEIARQAPRRVAKLALLNTNARPDSPESTANRRRLMALAEHDLDAAVAAIMPKLMTARHLEDARMVATITGMKRRLGKDVFIRQQNAIIGRIDSRPHLAAIDCPTLVLAAREDAIMPLELLEEIAAAIPSARLAIVEDSGHVAPIEQPAQVLAHVKAWILS